MGNRSGCLSDEGAERENDRGFLVVGERDGEKERARRRAIGLEDEIGRRGRMERGTEEGMERDREQRGRRKRGGGNEGETKRAGQGRRKGKRLKWRRGLMKL
eukprot:6188978-Pleurochrysis_carterae.AAC.1